MKQTEKLFRLIANTDQQYHWLMNWLAVRMQRNELSPIVVKIEGDDGGSITALLELVLGEIFGEGIVVVRPEDRYATYIAHSKGRNVIIIENWHDRPTEGRIRRKFQSFKIERCPAFTAAEISYLIGEIDEFRAYLKNYPTEIEIYTEVSYERVS